MLETYRIPFLLALGLHAILILAFALSPSTPTAPKSPSKAVATSAPVQAVAVNPQQIQAQVDQIKAAEEAKQQAARKQQEDLQKQANAAEKKRLQEEARFAKIKEAQKKAEKDLVEKQKAATAELEKIKKQQVEEKKKLEADKAKEAKEEKKAAAKKTKEDKEKALQEKLATEESKADKASTEDKPSEKKNEIDSKIQGELEKYQGLITQAIGRQWIVPDNVNQELSTKLLIKLAPGGMVIDVKLVTSSGDAALDRSAIAAVHKASPLPVPEDADIFDKFREFNLTVQPKDIVKGLQ